MSEEIDLKLLDRYLAGECTPAEEAMLRRWIESHPSHARTVDAVRAEWQQRKAPVEDMDAAWRRVAARTIKSPTHIPGTVRQPARSTIFQSRRYGSHSIVQMALAAALVLGAVGLFISKPAMFHRQTVQVATTAWRAVGTRRGQRATIGLSDGTQVILGADSKLRYAAVFQRNVREVYLEGEAYFEVVHAPDRPFIVHTSRSVVKVLGTKFGVQSYAADSTVQVAVAEGRVAFRATSPSAVAPSSKAISASTGTTVRTVLTRGDVGRLTTGGQLTVARGVNVADYLAWTHGQLVFKDTPFGDAAVQLARTYNVDIHIADPVLAKRRLTATIKEQPVSDLIASLALALDMRYERVGNSITVFRRPQ